MPGGYRHRYYATGVPGWVRFGYSPGWVGMSRAQAYWQATQGDQVPYPGHGPDMAYGNPGY